MRMQQEQAKSSKFGAKGHTGVKMQIPKFKYATAEGKNLKFLANTQEAPKSLQIHHGCQIIVRFALNTHEMDQSKQSISIQGVIMQNTALKLNAKKMKFPFLCQNTVEIQ